MYNQTSPSSVGIGRGGTVLCSGEERTGRVWAWWGPAPQRPCPTPDRQLLLSGGGGGLCTQPAPQGWGAERREGLCPLLRALLWCIHQAREEGDHSYKDLLKLRCVPTCALHVTYFLSTYFVPGTTTGPRDRQKGTKRHPALHLWEETLNEESHNRMHNYKLW